MENIADCFNVNSSTICRIICRRTFTRTAYDCRKLITTEHDHNSVDITVKWLCRKSLCAMKKNNLPSHSHSLLRRRMKKCELRPPDIKPTLNTGGCASNWLRNSILAMHPAGHRFYWWTQRTRCSKIRDKVEVNPNLLFHKINFIFVYQILGIKDISS